MKILDIKKVTNNKFLNYYVLELQNKFNKTKQYFIASRRSDDELACKTKNHNKCDGVMIVPRTIDGDFYLIRQFRPAINDYIYEFPAGLIDDGETIEEAARRELYEETGLTAKEYRLLIKPSYTSVGMSDESLAIVEMIVEGKPTNEHSEEDEDIEIYKVNKNQAIKLVERENVSIKAALVIKLS